MSMKSVADLCITELAAITSPVVPDAVQKVPSQHGDDRPRKNAKAWINLEPGTQERTDEANKSQLVGYSFIAHYWYSSKAHDLQDTADIQMDMADALFDKLGHNNLGGDARYGIAYDDTDTLTFEGGEDDDTTYVVRLPFLVWKQE
jgi:hypothetical protein